MPSNELPIRDIHLPDSLHWWPPAIGWWLLAILLIASLVGLSLLIKRYRKKWGYRNAALALLKKDYQHWRQQNQQGAKTISNQETLQQMLSILKRTAITAYPKVDAASLYGQRWVNFLNQQTNSDYFQQQCSDILLNQQYQASANIDITALYQACRSWIKHHHTTIKEGRC